MLGAYSNHLCGIEVLARSTSDTEFNLPLGGLLYIRYFLMEGFVTSFPPRRSFFPLTTTAWLPTEQSSTKAVSEYLPFPQESAVQSIKGEILDLWSYEPPVVLRLHCSPLVFQCPSVIPNSFHDPQPGGLLNSSDQYT
ncbi:unnamed protein product [Acanthoscelides obtectus]|uniref:Uncharacterized protein n=1 Tax=Acanthoscelides obtectus TaxID=200917 RepID=A0A9P0PEF6_ACAOB|nr:unnamed protein product [Acanthoscelides obtectus]CAK1655843.1 hypothetical protein AOBTE_LOCUS19381 [Acanthoscelides obtectus]